MPHITLADLSEAKAEKSMVAYSQDSDDKNIVGIRFCTKVVPVVQSKGGDELIYSEILRRVDLPQDDDQCLDRIDILKNIVHNFCEPKQGDGRIVLSGLPTSEAEVSNCLDLIAMKAPDLIGAMFNTWLRQRVNQGTSTNRKRR